MEKNLVLYHGTLRANALQIIKEQNFIIKDDIENKLFLGTGAYFYLNKEDALEWNNRTIIKQSKRKIFPSFIELKNKYSIVCAICNVNEENLLDLDNRNDVLKYKLILEKIKKVVGQYIDLNCKNQLSIIINYLYKQGLIRDVFVILKTFLYPINKIYGISIPKKIVCVKNTKVLKNYTEVFITKNEYENIKLLYKWGEYDG